MGNVTLDYYVGLALWVPLALAAVAALVWYVVAGRSRPAHDRRWGLIALSTLVAVVVPLPLWWGGILPITFEPRVPVVLWVTLALAAAGLLIAYAAMGRRRMAPERWWTLVGLMSLAVAIPLGVLLNPIQLRRIAPSAGKPLLTVLVDESASMDTADATGGKTRREVAQHIAAEVKSKLDGQYEVRVRPFAGGSSVSAETGSAGSTTDLATTIEDAMVDDRPQGQAILLISDGIHNAGGGSTRVDESARTAHAMTVPIFTKTVGGQAGVSDLEVQLNLPQELAFVGQRVPVTVNLQQRGSLATKALVSLISREEVIEQQEVELKADGASEAIFHVANETSGLYQYEIRAEPLAKEVTELNNSAPLVIRVVDQPVRVLLLEGKPYWDTKFLIRTLAQDRSIELTSVVRLAEGRLLKRTISRENREETGAEAAGEETLGAEAPGEEAAEAPVLRTESWSIEKDAGAILAEQDTLASYQIVVLGRDADVFLSDEALVRLKKWLIDGDGSLVCFRGPPAAQVNQRLGELLPVRWSPLSESRFRVEWTGAGRAMRWLPSADDDEDTLSYLPSLATTSHVERPKALAVVLAASTSTGPARRAPVITYQPVGSGRVVAVEGAGMWRWAFLPPDHQQHDEVYGTLWRSLVRWLVANVGLLPSQQLALRPDKMAFDTTENATATLLLREDLLGAEIPHVELSGKTLDQPRLISPVPSGKYPGQFRVPLGRLPEGRYWARVASTSQMTPAENDVAGVAAFSVRGNLKERLDVRAKPDLMRMIAQHSGGAVLEQVDAGPFDTAQLDSRFQKHLDESRPERIVRTAAWDRMAVLIGAFVLWGTCWGLRRRSGLV